MSVAHCSDFSDEELSKRRSRSASLLGGEKSVGTSNLEI